MLEFNSLQAEMFQAEMSFAGSRLSLGMRLRELKMEEDQSNLEKRRWINRISKKEDQSNLEKGGSIESRKPGRPRSNGAGHAKSRVSAGWRRGFSARVLTKFISQSVSIKCFWIVNLPTKTSTHCLLFLIKKRI